MQNYYVKLLFRTMIIGLAMIVVLNLGIFAGLATLGPFLAFGGLYLGGLIADMVKI